MNELQEHAEFSWSVTENGSCIGLYYKNCNRCPLSDGICYSSLQLAINWLLNNGFPASRPRIYTAKSLGEKIKAGYSKPTLVLWLNDHAVAVECPGCGKQVLYRETRKRCTGCGKIYPADRWVEGDPCECGSMDAKYAGKQTASRFGNLEFRQCETPDCRWDNHYRPLTVQELAGLAAIEADKQRGLKS